MKRVARGHPIDISEKLWNKRISRKRAPLERPFTVIQNVFEPGHVLVMTVARVGVKMLFTSFGFDLYQLRTLNQQGVKQR